MQASTGNSIDVFAEWFSDGPKWMQTAAARLATSTRVPAPEAIRALADLCIAEANGDEAVFETLPQGLFGATTGTEAFKL